MKSRGPIRTHGELQLNGGEKVPYINFTGIHVFNYLFSIKSSLKRYQDEISRTILKILPLRAPAAHAHAHLGLLWVKFSKLS